MRHLPDTIILTLTLLATGQSKARDVSVDNMYYAHCQASCGTMSHGMSHENVPDNTCHDKEYIYNKVYGKDETDNVPHSICHGDFAEWKTDSITVMPANEVTKDEDTVTDTCMQGMQESITAHVAERKVKKKKKGLIKSLATFIRNFSDVDTAYIEPQKFNFTVMMQNTNNYEIYRIASVGGNDFTFSPSWSFKVGPYIGWQWVFFGYTFDLKNIATGKKKTEFDLSIYSSQLGVDLFYRKTGADYKISSFSLGENVEIDKDKMTGQYFDGISVGIKGLNLYYIFNHKRFSYPAAFSQSTIQRRSAGSALCGIGYTQHSLNINWERLYNKVAENYGHDVAETYMDKNLRIKKVRYIDLSFSGGYAYNYVFARNFLAAASLAIGISYKKSESDTKGYSFSLRDFSFSNLSLDGVGRFGIVWNNMRWYVGANTIFHTYNYHKPNFYTNSIFGSVNVYVGVNFGRKNSK